MASRTYKQKRWLMIMRPLKNTHQISGKSQFETFEKHTPNKWKVSFFLFLYKISQNHCNSTLF